MHTNLYSAKNRKNESEASNRELSTTLLQCDNRTVQVTAVLTAKRLITAAIYRITLAHAEYSVYLTIGPEMLLP